MTPKRIDPYELRPKIKALAPELAEGLKRAAATARNETELRDKAGRIIDRIADELGLKFQTRLEFYVADAGYIDALYNRFVIEYEAPGNLTVRDGRANQESKQQIVRYVGGLAPVEKRDRYAGVCTDGNLFIFGRTEEGVWRFEAPVPVNERTAEVFLQYLAALTIEKPLTAENLIRDFGVGSDAAHELVPRFYEMVTAGATAVRAEAIFGQWAENFSEACDYKEGIADAKATKLQKAAGQFGIEDRTPQALPLYFAIHTYFAFIVKLLALHLGMIYRYRRRPPVINDARDLRGWLAGAEGGGFFDQMGIKNYLEGDFFGWYLDQWSDDLGAHLWPVVDELSRYDFPGTEAGPRQYRDVLQNMYQDLMPHDLRHDLGEYYTPDWLVERILNQLGYDGRDPLVRILDPACGSGTFLYHEIRRVRAEGHERFADERALLAHILDNVVGFDLNPVAVITARTSYLLALGDLLDYQDENIFFPVYTADSIMTHFTQTPKGKTERLEHRGARVIETQVGEFRLPERLSTLSDVGRLMSLIALHARNELTSEAFVPKAQEAFPDFDGDDLSHVTFTYERVLDLERRGMNGIWGQIVTNAFAPVFAGKFDLIAGNPPWINWQHLPERYRQSTKELWGEYGLFPHTGMDTILGKGKKDISTLMTFVAMDKYLKKDGKLGFVITQSVFKTGGAGQGFRRFQLGDAEHIRVVAVDDMVELKPFPGVGNRTAVMILQKGRKTKYPVPYEYWKKQKRASLKPEMTLTEVSELTSRLRFYARPVSADDPTSAWMTGRKKALAAAEKVLGKSDYVAHAGVNSGGANGVYWVDIIDERPDGLLVVRNITEGIRRPVPEVEAVVEPDLVYPLLRGRDVKRWRAEPSAYIIMVQDPIKRRGIDIDTMKERHPHTYAYLKRFEDILRERAAYHRYFKETDPFYSMFNVGDYTFASWKVAWPWISQEFVLASVGSFNGKPILPEHNVSLYVPKDEEEAYFLSGLLNSSLMGFAVRGFYSGGGGGLGAPSTLEKLIIHDYNSKEKNYAALSKLSKNAHELAAAAEQEKLASVEAEINERVAHLYGITDTELKEIQKSLAELLG